jgi:hypothetical protein
MSMGVSGMKDCKDGYQERIVVVECEDGRHSNVLWSKTRNGVGGEENGAGRRRAAETTATRASSS